MTSWTPPQPTWAGFVQYVQQVVGVPHFAFPGITDANVEDSGGNQVTDYLGAAVTSLPANVMSPSMFSYWLAWTTVNDTLCIGSNLQYTHAVYSLGMHNLVTFMPDVQGQTYWRDLREKYNANTFIVGVVTSSSDNGTASSYLNPEVMKNLTFADLQTMTTPWGRAYMGIAQSVGSLWGLT